MAPSWQNFSRNGQSTVPSSMPVRQRSDTAIQGIARLRDGSHGPARLDAGPGGAGLRLQPAQAAAGPGKKKMDSFQATAASAALRPPSTARDRAAGDTQKHGCLCTLLDACGTSFPQVTLKDGNTLRVSALSRPGAPAALPPQPLPGERARAAVGPSVGAYRHYKQRPVVLRVPNRATPAPFAAFTHVFEAAPAPALPQNAAGYDSGEDVSPAGQTLEYSEVRESNERMPIENSMPPSSVSQGMLLASQHQQLHSRPAARHVTLTRRAAQA